MHENSPRPECGANRWFSLLARGRVAYRRRNRPWQDPGWRPLSRHLPPVTSPELTHSKIIERPPIVSVQYWTLLMVCITGRYLIRYVSAFFWSDSPMVVAKASPAPEHRKLQVAPEPVCGFSCGQVLRGRDIVGALLMCRKS